MEKGYFTFVLHGHLPFCRKAGTWPFGEEWVFEAMTETYIPFLSIVETLKQKNIDFKLTLSLTPVLLEQLTDEYMLENFSRYIKDRIKRAEGDIKRFDDLRDGRMRHLAEYTKEKFEEVYNFYNNILNRDLIGSFRKLQDEGFIEILVSTATHGYLPLLSKASVYSQIKVGLDTYEKHFHRRPEGMWLPECGYKPKIEDEKLEEILEDFGIRYFFVDTHAIQGGKAAGQYLNEDIFSDGDTKDIIKPTNVGYTGNTTYRPYYVDSSNVSVFGRNERTGLQVWSGEWGYPGDGNYREFHKHDEESGLRYWKITSRLVELDGKDIYEPENAMERVEEQSSHFVSLIEKLLDENGSMDNDKSIIVAPYDIELFGHWWFEGLWWLEKVMEKLHHSGLVSSITPAQYLHKFPATDRISIHESSWGLGGKHDVWKNSKTEWMWHKIYDAEEILDNISRVIHTEDKMQNRLFEQATKELLLMQSSDWPFLVTTDQAGDYGKERFTLHCNNFYRLIEAINNNSYDDSLIQDLGQMEETHNVFKGIKCKYSSKALQPSHSM